MIDRQASVCIIYCRQRPKPTEKLQAPMCRMTCLRVSTSLCCVCVQGHHHAACCRRCRCRCQPPAAGPGCSVCRARPGGHSLRRQINHYGHQKARAGARLCVHGMVATTLPCPCSWMEPCRHGGVVDLSRYTSSRRHCAMLHRHVDSQKRIKRSSTPPH